MKTTPSKLLAELLSQHESLRKMMDHCEELADELDAGKGDPLALTREVAKLRLAFDAHNKFEEQLLRPVLREMDAFGDVRIERMFSDHVTEHREMRAQLGSDATNALRATIDSLRVHLQAEERYFLSSKVLRDDLVSVENGG
ncbi:MAG TPA: hemerythrin domain-containing protein [Kofleriaceae bacterium]|nr:hemerythrin domain-containing protein [Kofleriaceae bacterium]